MFYVHCFFIPMKMITNAMTYNALSSVIPLWVGQGANLNMLLCILAMQVPVRGLCCGKLK